MYFLCLFLSVLFTPPQAIQVGRIEGRVVSTAGEPIAKAEVRIFAGNGDGAATVYVEVTAADGSFVADGIPAGSYGISAQRAGYQWGHGPGQIISKGETQRVEVQLRPFVTVNGTVVDPAGEPVSNVTVALRSPSLQMAFQERAATTDDIGAFSLTDVDPGDYLVAIVPPRVTGPERTIEIRGASAQREILPTYFPGVANPADAKLLRVRSSVVGLELHVLRGPRSTVLVTVPSSDPDSGYYVTLKSKRHDETGETSRGAVDGKVVIPSVPPGDYVVRVTPRSGGSRVVVHSVDVAVADANVEVAVPLSQARTLKGRVRVEGVADFASFLAGVQAAGREVSTPLTLYLFGLPEYFPTSLVIPVARDGSFEVPNVAPIEYLLSNPIPQVRSVYVKSVSLNGKPVPGDLIDLRGTGESRLEIVLSPRSGTIQLTPPDGWPTSGASAETQRILTVWTAQPSSEGVGGWSASTLMPANLSYIPRIEGVPPGTYFAVAWEELPSSALAGNPRFLARLADLAARVTVEEGGRATVQAKLIPRAELRRLIVEVPER